MTDAELLKALSQIIAPTKSQKVRSVLLSTQIRLDAYHKLCGSVEAMEARIKRYQLRIRNLEYHLGEKQQADPKQQAIIRRLNEEIDEMRKEKWNG